jgi:autotransporter translocation and assembly factor TamB
LTAFLAVLPSIPPFKQFILSFVDRQTSSLLSCKVTIGEIAIDLRKGLVIKNIVLSDSHSRGGPLLAEQVAARIDLRALLRGRVELRSIKIAGLSGKLLKVHQGLFAGPVDIGRITAPVLKNPNKTVVKSKPLVRMVSIESCTLSYVDSVKNIEASETVSSLRLEFIRADSMSFVMQAGAGHCSSPVWRGGVRSIDVQGALGPASLLFSKAEVRGDSVSASFHGTIPLSMEKAWNLTANADAFVAGFPYVNKNAPPLKPVGKIKAKGVMTGTVERPVLNMTVTGYGLQAGTVAADSLFLQADYSDDRLRGKARFWSQEGTADASVRADVFQLLLSPAVGKYTITASAGNVDISKVISVRSQGRYRPAFPADAGLFAAGSGLRRLPDTMSADIRATTKPTAASPMSLSVRLAGNKWELTAAMRSDITVRGNGLYTARGAINGSFHVQADTISRIASFFLKENVRGSIIADALMTGTFRKPSISALLRIGQCSYGRYHADTVSARVLYGDQSLRWQSLAVKNGKSVMLSDGMVSWAKRNKGINADCKFTFDQAVSSGLVVTATGDLAYTNGIATATIHAVQKGSGIPLTVTAHIPVALHEISRGITAIRDGAVVTVNGDSIAYGGLINAFAPSVQSLGTISLHGTLLKANGEWGLSCSTHVANKGLTEKREEIKAGRAVLDLHIAGPLVRPAARFTLSGDSIEYRGNLITAYSGSGSITSDVLKLDTLHVATSGGGADLSATVPVSLKHGFSFGKNGRISATFTAMPFSIVQPFMPEAMTIDKGEISGRVVATGTAEGMPQATGTISLRNGECYIYECDKPLGPLSVDLDFNNDSIIMRRLQSKWGKGSIAGSGGAVFGVKGISAAHSVIKLSAVRLGGCYENLDLGIQTADINLTKDSLITITVNALLADTRFTQDFSLIEIGERLRKKAPQTLRPPNPLFNKVVMRIAVNLNSNLTFDSNLGTLLVDGTVTAAGRPDKPLLTGQFKILNGFVYYFDRKFTVTEGTIRQYDPQRINPSLDISATSSVSWYPPQGGKEDYDITLLIKGDLSDPLIALSAVPSLAQPQIISLLTFGTIQTGVGTDLGSRTGGALVSQQLAGFSTRKLARFLNVESVGINGNVFDPSSAGPQLSVTKQVSSRVAVTYRMGLSKLSQQMVLVSYRLLPFLYLDGETDQQAQGGIDLKLRYSR